jgi:hypothetical protein
MSAMETTMRASTVRQPLNGICFRRIALALALATAVCALPMRPAIAQDRDGHDRQVQSDREHRDDRYNHHDRRDQDERRAPRYRYHQYPVYVPPPVYYPRHASPGISLVFPFEIR